MGHFLARQRWWLTRTLVLPVHILLFSIGAFFLVRLVPGDPVLARMDLTGGFNKADYDRMADAMGLGGSIWGQLADFLKQIITLDLGTSVQTNQPIWTELLSRLPSTLELIFLGLFGAVLVTLALGMCWMLTGSRWVQKALTFYANLTGALPDFAVAIVSILVLYVVFPVVPAPIGRVSPGTSLPDVTGFPLLDCLLTGRFDVFWSMAAHYVLPVGVIVFIHAAGLWRQLKLGIEEQIDDPATLFKVASGATRRSVYRSVLRRASATAIVTLGAKFGGMLGGVIVLERLFGFGGVGQFAIDSVNTLDFPGLQGFLIVIAALCLTTFFLVDIVNMLLDPRRRPGVKVDA